MTKTITAFGFLLVLSLFTVGVSTGLLQQAEAQRDSDADMQCREGQVLVYHFNFRKYICTSSSGAAQWVQHGIAEIVGGEAPMDDSMERVDKADFAKSSPETVRLSEIQDILEKQEAGERLSKSEQRMLERVQQFVSSQQTAEEFYGDASKAIPVTAADTAHQSRHGLTASGTLTSMDDPNNPTEEELVVILQPSEKMYIGKITFSASEPIQYVSFIGPLGPADDGGQPIWSPDGGATNYATVMVDQGLKSGGWYFAGNALALHTFDSEPFTVTYNVAYSEIEAGVYPKGTVDFGTIQSSPDPGIGHEGHSLAIILPPREIPYQGGVLAYSVSEPVQLVALHGPLGPGEDMGQATWTADGENVYALTLIEDIDNMGVWNTFSGNALALHTMNPDGFTASYALGGLH